MSWLIIKLTIEITDNVSDPDTKLKAFAQLTNGHKYIIIIKYVVAKSFRQQFIYRLIY